MIQRDEATQNGKLYYGWVITFTLAVTETISWGIIYYAFSVFITPMEADMGWSRGQLTGAFSLMLLVTAALAFPVGAWIDRHGARGLMTVGSVLASLLVVAWSQVTDLTALYLIWFGLGVCAASVLYEPAFTVIAAWFIRRRGTALAIVTFAAGLASTIFVPLSDVLLNAVGWRDAVLLLGLFLAVTTIPLHALVLRRRPDDLGVLPDGRTKADATHTQQYNATLGEALQSRFFWMLTLAFSLSNLAASAVRVHFIPLLIDAGVAASTAALASGAIGVMQVTGRVFFAPLDARYSGRTMTTGVFAMQAAGIGLLLFGTSAPVILLFLLIFGTSFGARTLARPAILAELFGSASYGRIASINAIFGTLAATIAPVAAGWLYDTTGGYDLMLWLVVGFTVCAVVVMLLSKPEKATNDAL